jgi:hypothetical protein
MRHLNVAPSQIHLGAWAFIRGFERACFLFGRSDPSHELFFYLFDVQRTPGLDGRGLVSLKERKPLIFQPLSDTYKDFKDNYFKVTSLAGKEPFWAGDRFPLSWSPAHFSKKASEYSFPSSEKLSASDLVLLRLFEKLVAALGERPIKVADILRRGVADTRASLIETLSEF